MKKPVFLIMFLLTVGSVFGQDAFLTFLTEISVKSMISLIGKPVPSGYTRIDREHYTDRIIEVGSITLITNGYDDIVIEGSIGAIFDTTHDASFYLSRFYTYFEATEEWQYRKTNFDTYTNNNIIAIIISPYKRIDGNIVAEVVFRKLI